MRYRRLPLEIELEARRQNQGEEAEAKARANLLAECMSHKGFQIVTAVLRSLEAAALHGLRLSGPAPERLLGRLTCIEEIRRSLVALLPDDKRAAVDWFDDEEEVYTNLDSGE